MNKPLSSFILTTFNEELYIEPSLRSIANQTYENKEIIVVDAESKDKTVEIAKKYANKILVKKCDMPNGRNEGAKLAEGEIFCFIDADIILLNDWLYTLLMPLENPSIVAAYHNLLPKETNYKARLAYQSADLVHETLRALNKYIMKATALALKRSIFEKIGGYTTKFAHCEDTDILLKLSKEGKIKFLKTTGGYFSTRRLEKYGYSKTFLFWSIETFNYLFLKKLPSKVYPRV